MATRGHIQFWAQIYHHGDEEKRPSAVSVLSCRKLSLFWTRERVVSAPCSGCSSSVGMFSGGPGASGSTPPFQERSFQERSSFVSLSISHLDNLPPSPFCSCP